MKQGYLQHRSAVSLATSLQTWVLQLLLFSSRFAATSELPRQQAVYVDEPIQVSYEPSFSLFDRDIIGRAPSDTTTTLSNNGPESMKLEPGSTACFMVQKSTIFAVKADKRGALGSNEILERQSNEGDEKDAAKPNDETATKTVYISVNTCTQPDRVSPDATTMDPPQLSLFVTTDDDVGCPDTSKDMGKIQWKVFDEGAVTYSVNATGNVFIGVSAPTVAEAFQGAYSFEIAVSTESYYHNYEGEDTSELQFVSSDSSSVLLVTKDLTQNASMVEEVMKEGLPYELFVEDEKSKTLNGLHHSVCGLQKHAAISVTNQANAAVNNLARTAMTMRGPEKLPKQQFYFVGLNASSSYSGVLVKRSGSTSLSKRQNRVAGGGGTVFRPTQFQTQTGTNCKVVTDLEFCDEVQYAVPGNDAKFNNTALARKYDDYAKEMYGNFEKVMMQIPCEIRTESLFSLATNCNACKAFYKRWLCTVSFPRCEDFTSSNEYSIMRNVGQAFPNGTMLPEEERTRLGKTPAFNSSRNGFIDTDIQPGPYKELLPCDDVCYDVVQHCPAAIGFRCPQPYMPSFNVSYGRQEFDSNPSCNAIDLPSKRSGVGHLLLPAGLALGLAPLLTICLLLLAT